MQIRDNHTAAPCMEEARVASAVPPFIDAACSASYRDVPMLAPYGVVSRPATGSDTLLLFAGGRAYCAGFVMPDTDAAQTLEEGEVMLCANGGACIKLLQDGGILLNGSVQIDPDGTIHAKAFVQSE